MKILIASLVATMAFVGAALAGEIEGTVQSVDASGKTIMLANGSEFAIGAGVSLEGVAAGSVVKIVYDDDSRTATEISPK
ncbi:MAG: DUF1344 domain-containing protein [Rhizobiaceae bacterium]|nr:DUF1344 domain-containing protein [Rhizobiaceae bacterium]